MVIVAAVDRSDRAERVVAEAVELSNAFDEPLHVVHVMDESDYVRLEQTAFEKTGRSIPIEKVRNIAKGHAEDVAADVAAEFEPVGLMGDAASMVLSYAEEQDARYIVVTGRKRSPAGKALFGSVVQSILLNADRPIVSAAASRSSQNDDE